MKDVACWFLLLTKRTPGGRLDTNGRFAAGPWAGKAQGDPGMSDPLWLDKQMPV
jgi:hypothetical protein